MEPPGRFLEIPEATREDLINPLKSACALCISIVNAMPVDCDCFTEINIISICKEKTKNHPVNAWKCNSHKVILKYQNLEVAVAAAQILNISVSWEGANAEVQCKLSNALHLENITGLIEQGKFIK